MTTTEWAAHRDPSTDIIPGAWSHNIAHIEAADGTRSRCGHARLDATTRQPAALVPPETRCRAKGCRKAWPPEPQPDAAHAPAPPAPGALICPTDTCIALATHAVTRHEAGRLVQDGVRCEICAVRYRHRHYPGAAMSARRAYRAALEHALPSGRLYQIWVGILADLRPAGICNAPEARLRLGQARRDRWAVQIFPGGGIRAADPQGGFVGDLSPTLVIQAMPRPDREPWPTE